MQLLPNIQSLQGSPLLCIPTTYNTHLLNTPLLTLPNVVLKVDYMFRNKYTSQVFHIVRSSPCSCIQKDIRMVCSWGLDLAYHWSSMSQSQSL